MHLLMKASGDRGEGEVSQGEGSLSSGFGWNGILLIQSLPQDNQHHQSSILTRLKGLQKQEGGKKSIQPRQKQHRPHMLMIFTTTAVSVSKLL